MKIPKHAFAAGCLGLTACSEVLGVDELEFDRGRQTSASAGGTASSTTSSASGTGGAGGAASTGPTSSSTGAGGAREQKRVFVTSATFTPSMLDGVTNANSLCQNIADGPAALGGSWRAWLSESGMDGIDNIQGDGPWHRLSDGALVFDSHADIVDWTSDDPHSGIRYDELLADRAGAYVWTGTTREGQVSFNCSGWSDGSGTGATYGIAGNADYTWTDDNLQQQPCTSAYRLYCFEE